MPNKIIMVTGATDGIGKEAARQLAQQGAEVVIVGRNSAKCEQVVAELRAKTENPNIHTLVGDLSSIDATRHVAEQFKAKWSRLDVLVNNVGAMMLTRQTSVDGFEMTFALNHLVGYFWLTHLLMDVLKASAPSRIVNTSSDAHFGGKLDFDDLQYERRRYQFFAAYSASKLMNVMYTYELARRLEGTGVTANVLHPGFVASNFAVTNNWKYLMKPARFLMNVLAISLEKGAQTSVYLATSPEVAQVSGQYFEKSKPYQSSTRSDDVEGQKRLWAISEELLGIKR